MKRRLLMAGVLTIALMTAGCAGQRSSGAPESGVGDGQAPNQIEEVQTAVEVETLSKGMIRESFYSMGTVEAGRTYSMNALVSADVKTVYVDLGDAVKAGDLLFELETDDFNTSKTSQLSSVKAQMDSARIQKDSAQKSYDDVLVLYNEGVSSKNELDQAKDALDAAVISYNSARTAYNTTLSSLSSSGDNYLVTSPIDGIVTARSVEEGQFASTQNGITVSEYNPVKIAISVPGARVSQAYVGQPVRVTFPTQETEIEATLSTLNMSGESGGYPAEIKLENPDHEFLPGMIAEVYLETERVEDAFVVTKNTVQEDDNGAYVFVVEEGHAKRVNVTTGLEDGEQIQIIGTLNEGDEIVIKGQQYIKDQDAVLIK